MLRRTCALASIAFVLSLSAATNAMATAQRTFVASNGNDANPCSIVSPCRAFAAAIAQTIAGGEVIVLDSAGYGPVTISQSVSIIAPAGVYAGITVPSGGTGVAINGAGTSVVLRGLAINSTGGTYGIRMTNGSELNVENCVISNFRNSAKAVSVETAAIVKIADTVVRDATYGIVVGHGATANITNSQVVGSDGEGIWLFQSNVTTNIFITDTLVTGNGIGGSAACIDNDGLTGNISASRVSVTGCLFGIINQSSSGTMTVTNSIVTGNVDGFHNFSGTFNSLGNNNVSGNTNDIQGGITTIGGK